MPRISWTIDRVRRDIGAGFYACGSRHLNVKGDVPKSLRRMLEPKWCTFKLGVLTEGLEWRNIYTWILILANSGCISWSLGMPTQWEEGMMLWHSSSIWHTLLI